MEVANLQAIIYCVSERITYVKSLLFYKMDFIARTAMLFNSSINFIVYCAVSESFKVRNILSCLYLLYTIIY